MLLVGVATTQGADIEGTIVIKRKLTKRKITAAASFYQRGGAVDLGLDPTEDPLSLEGGRVVIYLDSSSPDPWDVLISSANLTRAARYAIGCRTRRTSAYPVC